MSSTTGRDFGSTHLTVSPDPRSRSVSRRSSTCSERSDTEVVATKPKVTKSRNGCITCKAKRLKCDEKKPTCLQCQKRGVECGGYKKNFKWKSFSESSFAEPGSSCGKTRDVARSESLEKNRSPVLREGNSSPSQSPEQKEFAHNLGVTTETPGIAFSALFAPPELVSRQASWSSYHSYTQGIGALEHLQVPGDSSQVSQGPHIRIGNMQSSNSYALPQVPGLEYDSPSFATLGSHGLVIPRSATAYQPSTTSSALSPMESLGLADQLPLPQLQSSVGAMGQQSQIDLGMNPVDTTLQNSQMNPQSQWYFGGLYPPIELDEETIQRAMAEMFPMDESQLSHDFGPHQRAEHNDQIEKDRGAVNPAR